MKLAVSAKRSLCLVVLLCGFSVSCFVHSVPITVNAGDTLSLSFNFPQPFVFTGTPDVLFAGVTPGQGVPNNFASGQAKLFNGNTLLGTTLFGLGTGNGGHPAGTFFSTEAATINPLRQPAIDFTSIRNRTINGVEQLRLSSPFVFDPYAPLAINVQVGTCPDSVSCGSAQNARVSSILLNGVPIYTAASDFARRVSNPWPVPIISGNVIYDFFRPDLSGLGRLSGTTNSLAALGGFDHFNFEQDITSISGPAINLGRGIGIDPLIGGNPGQHADNYAWYLDEVFVPDDHWTTTYYDPRVLRPDDSLLWSDAPNLGLINVGTTLEFSDYLVGVYADHTGVRISDLYPDARNVNFKWSLTQGLWGGIPGNPHFDGDIFGPPEPGSDGSIKFLGFFGNDQSVPEPTTLALLAAGLLSLVCFGVKGCSDGVRTY